MSLVYVALRERGPDASLTLREVVEILHFVYFDIYGTTFAARYNEEERDVYTCYLEELLVQRVRSLSGRVHLSEI